MKQRSDAPSVLMVTDGWLANAGDAAILTVLSRGLRRRLPGTRVVVASHHRRLLGRWYRDLDLVPPLDALTGASHPWSEPGDHGAAARAEVERLLRKSPVIVAPGGGYLVQAYGPRSRIDAYELLLDRGHSLVFAGVSVGEFTGVERDRLANVLGSSAAIAVRDDDSLRNVKRLGVTPGRIRRVEDLGFALCRRAPLRRARGPHSVLLCPSDHPWDQASRCHARLDLLRVALSAATALARTGMRVTMASTVQGLGGPAALEDDQKVAREVVALADPRTRRRLNIVGGHLSVTSFRRLATLHDTTVAMRMHAAVLSLSARTPSVLLNGSAKARALGAAGLPTPPNGAVSCDDFGEWAARSALEACANPIAATLAVARLRRHAIRDLDALAAQVRELSDADRARHSTSRT